MSKSQNSNTYTKPQKPKYERMCPHQICPATNSQPISCPYNHNGKIICPDEFRDGKCENYLCLNNHHVGYIDRLKQKAEYIESHPIANPENECRNSDSCKGKKGGCYFNHPFAIYCINEVISNGNIESFCIQKECPYNHSRNHITNWRRIHTIPDVLVSDAIPQTALDSVVDGNN